MASMQFSRRWSSNDCLDEAYVPFFGAFGTARDDPIIARWSANLLAMLWPGAQRCDFRWRNGNRRPQCSIRWSSSPPVGAEAIHRADCCRGIREWCSAMS